MINRFIDLIYKKHIGFVFKHDVSSINKIELSDSVYKYEVINDAVEVSDFYKKVGSNHLNLEVIKSYLDSDTRFYCIKHNDEIVAINAIFFNHAYYSGLSFFTMLEKKHNKIILDKKTVYSGLIVVDPGHRGKKLYSNLVGYVAENLYQNSIDNIILTTGIKNSSMIKATLDLNGKLIRIVEIKRIFRFLISQNEIYNNKSEVDWISKK